MAEVTDPRLICNVRYSNAAYFGRRPQSNEVVELDVPWLNDNYMNARWRRTLRAHPGVWFPVHRAARTKQTAVVLRDQ